MTIQNFFTGVPEDWFFRFFDYGYIEKRDAESIALVDKDCLKRVQYLFGTLHVSKTPLSNVKYQICTEDTISLEECYETLEKYRLRHLSMVLSRHPEDTFSCIKECTQSLPALSMLSLKVSFTFRHSHNICYVMETMKDRGCSFGTVTFVPTMDQNDFQNNLKTIRSLYLAFRKCLNSFPEVTTKAIYDFPSYRITADATDAIVIDCSKFSEEYPSALTEIFLTRNIPSLKIVLDTLEDIWTLQSVVPEQNSVQHLGIVFPYVDEEDEAKNGDGAYEDIQERYQGLFNLIQTKFTNIIELVISTPSPSPLEIISLSEEVIHPILRSFPDTKVFLAYNVLEVDFHIEHKNFQTMSLIATPPNQVHNENLSSAYDSEAVQQVDDSSVPRVTQEDEEQFKVVMPGNGNIRYVPKKPSLFQVRTIEALSIKLSEKKSFDMANMATSRLYSNLANFREMCNSLKIIFIKPRIFNNVSPASIQGEFNDLSLYINRVASYLFNSNKLEKIVLNSDNLYVGFPDNTQLIKEELNELKAIHGDLLEISEPTIIRIDPKKMEDEEFCYDLMTKTSVNGLVFDAATKTDFELFNTQFGLFTGSPMNVSVKTAYLNLSEDLREIDDDSIAMYYSEIISLLSHFPKLKKVHFEFMHFKNDTEWYYDFLQEMISQVLEEKPQITFSLHSDGTKISLIMTSINELKVTHASSLELENATPMLPKIVNSLNMTNDEFCVELMTSGSINEIVFEISEFEEPGQFMEQFNELFKEAPMRTSVKMIHLNLSENMKEISQDDLLEYYCDILLLIRQFTNLKEVHFRAAHLGVEIDQNYTIFLKIIERILENPQIKLFLYRDKVADLDFKSISHRNLILI